MAPARGLAFLAAIGIVALALAACTVNARLPTAVPFEVAPDQPAERIPIVLRTSWAKLVAAAEAEIPRCQSPEADGDCSTTLDRMIMQKEDSWEPIGTAFLGSQLGVQGSVWRQDPLAITVSGNKFEASVRLLYRTRLGLVSGRQLASCGYDEAPREAIVHLSGDLHVAGDWYVDAKIVASVEAENHCRATLLNLNVTDWILDPIRERLQTEADDAEQRVSQITNVREIAVGIWTKLAEPMAIAPDTWIALNPVAAYAGALGLTKDQRYLTMPVAVKASPKVTLGSKPSVAASKLPDLITGDIRPDFSVAVRALISYDQASATLSALLRGGGLAAGLQVDKATVSGNGTKVVVALKVRGLLNGTLYLWGTPRFAPRSDGTAGGELSIDDLDFIVDTRSLVGRIGTSVFRARILETLRKNSHWDVSSQLQSALATLSKGLNRDLSSQARLAGRLTKFGPGEVRVGPRGLEAWYRIGGNMEVVLSPL